MGQLQALVRHHNRAVLCLFLAATIVAACFATRVEIDGSVDRLLLREDPARLLDERAKQDFGNDEIIMVGFELARPYTAQDLRKLGRISQAVAELENVRRVRDLSSTEDIRGAGDTLDAGPLVDFETLERDFPSIRARTKDHPLYDRLLVSDDGRALGMMIYAESIRSNDVATNQLTARVIALADELAAPWSVHYAGYPVTAYEVNRIVKQDLARLTPLALVVISLVLFFATRRVSFIALFLALVVWVELVALGWLGFSQTPINVVISTLPTILVATTGTYLVYAVGLLRSVDDSECRAAALVALLFRPVLLSALSTAIGFGSLRLIGMQSAGDLGVALSVGILAAAAGTLLLVPALIHRFDLRIECSPPALVTRLGDLGVHLAARPVAVVATAACVLAMALPGLARLELHTDTLQYFADDNRVRTGARFFQDHLSSGFLLNVVIRGEEENRALDPDTLAFAEQLVDGIEEIPEVGRTVSMLDYFGLMDTAMRPGETPRPHPESRQLAAQYLLLYESSGDPGDYERYLDFDRSALSIIVSIEGGSSVYLESARKIARWAEAAPGDLRVDTLGTTFLYSKAMDDLTRGMIGGLMLASALIFCVLAIGLGSIPLALLATIPNLLPIVIGGGLLGWLGVPISMSTSLMGCIALGLAVDDTSHVVGHVSREEPLEALYRLVGSPILLTTLALCAGFSALLASEFATVSVLGASVIATLLLALLADVLLLPSLLALAGYPRTAADRARTAEAEAADEPTLEPVRRRRPGQAAARQAGGASTL